MIAGEAGSGKGSALWSLLRESVLLVALDVDGTLIRSFMEDGKAVRPFADVEVLPGRRERIRELAARGYQFALVTNQAGVAMGFQSEAEAWSKLARVWAAFDGFYGRPVTTHVCFHHPQARLEEWRENPCPRRKPGPGLLWEARDAHGTTRAMVYVGDLDSDRQAALAAGVTYVDAEVFFR